MLSLETCQKLKEAGWPQEHRVNLGHGYYNHKRGPNDGPMAMWSVDQWPIDGFVFLCAQPTLEELLEAIREMADSIRNGDDNDLDICWYLELHDEGDRYSVHQVPISDKWTGITIEHTDPSEAAAALWLKLKGVQ